MTLISAFCDWLEKRQAYLEQDSSNTLHRRMFVLTPEMTPSVLPTLANTIQSALIVSPDKRVLNRILNKTSLSQGDFNAIETAKYRTILGTEVDHCIFDARQGTNLDALIAVSGLIRPSGMLCILLPTHLHLLPQIQNTGIAHSYSQAASDGAEVYYFYRFFIRALQRQDVLTIDGQYKNTDTSLSCLETLSLNKELSELSLNQAKKPDTYPKQKNNLQALSEQQENIIRQVSSSTATLHIIMGKRGRGKSTALAACSLACAQKYKVFICAPKRSQIVIFEEYINKMMLGGNKSNSTNQALYEFVAPDQALNILSEEHESQFALPTLLLIDEVASIAPSLLHKLIKLASKTVLAGTTQGYEGSGQGFIQRVVPSIQELYDYRLYELKTSFRWLNNDPIETFLEDLLFVNEKQTNAVSKIKALNSRHSGNNSNLDEISVKILEKTELINNDVTCAQVLSLLREAHYQTSPNDIVRLLDDTAYSIIVAQYSQSTDFEIVGLAIVIKEGGTPLTPMASAIAHGKRRLQGHLSPQSLSLYLLDKQWCSYHNLRINRIAVKSEHRRKCIASSILEYCSQQAKANNIDYLSTSYGVNRTLYRFWRNNDFIPVKIGNRVDTSSGVVSMLMIKNISLEQWPIQKAKIERQLNLELSFYRQVYAHQAINDAINVLSELPLLDKPIPHYINHIRNALLSFAKGEVTLDKVASQVWYFIICSGHLNSPRKLADDSEVSSLILQRALMMFYSKGVHQAERERIALQLKTFIESNIYLLNNEA